MKFQRMHIAASLGTALLLSALSFSVHAADFTFKLHQFLPAQANVPKHVLEVWANKVKEDSKGRIEVQLYPSMQLGGKPPELMDQVIDGTVDLAWVLPGYTPGRFPHTEVFELPFMMTNAEATSRAFWDLAQETMINDDFKDIHVVGLWVHGPGLIHSKNPIKTIADLNGVKLRAPTRVTNMLFSSLGATPIGMPVPEVPEALSKGVIDAAVIPWEVTGSIKIPELVHNHTGFKDASLYTTTFVLAMNKDSYAKLPDDLKAVIDKNSGAEFSAFAGKTQQAYDEPSRELAVKNKNNIMELDDAEVAKWREASQPTIDKWVKEMDDKKLDGTGLLKKTRELIAKYTAEQKK